MWWHAHRPAPTARRETWGAKLSRDSFSKSQRRQPEHQRARRSSTHPKRSRRPLFLAGTGFTAGPHLVGTSSASPAASFESSNTKGWVGIWYGGVKQDQVGFDSYDHN